MEYVPKFQKEGDGEITVEGIDEIEGMGTDEDEFEGGGAEGVADGFRYDIIKLLKISLLKCCGLNEANYTAFTRCLLSPV